MTKDERHGKFREDMKEAGYDVEDYRGRNSYDGPAVRIGDADDLQDVIRATEIRVQWEAMGRDGLIIYPR